MSDPHPAASSDNTRLRIVASYESVLPMPQADGEVFVNTAAALARRGHRVTLFAPAQSGRPTPPSAEILEYYGTTGPLDIREIDGTDANVVAQMTTHALRFARHHECRAADVVYVRNPFVLLLSIAYGHRVFFDHYRPWGDQIPPLAPLLRQAMTHPNFLGGVIHSELSLQSYLRLGIPASRLIVAHNGYDPHRLEPRLDPVEARRRLDLPVDRKVVVYTGRVDDSKGLEVLLDAADQLENVTFLLVGVRGPSEIQTRGEKLPNVRVVGWLPPSELPIYLHAADVLVIPPSVRPLLERGHTILPLKVFLYLGAGRAILAPDNPDVGEVLNHGENAHLVDPAEPDAALKGLETLLEDDVYRQRLAEGAAAHAEHLTWDMRAERIEQHLLTRYRAHQTSGGEREISEVPFPPPGFARDLARWLAGLPQKRWTLRARIGKQC